MSKCIIMVKNQLKNVHSISCGLDALSIQWSMYPIHHAREPHRRLCRQRRRTFTTSKLSYQSVLMYPIHHTREPHWRLRRIRESICIYTPLCLPKPEFTPRGSVTSDTTLDMIIHGLWPRCAFNSDILRPSGSVLEIQ